MSSLVSRAVLPLLVSVHGHKQLTTSASLYGRSMPQAQNEWHEKLGSLSMAILFAVNLAVFLPAILYVCYTLGLVMPTLASVEDAQDKYEPIPSNDDEIEGKGEKSAKAAVSEAEEAGAIKSRPVTSGVRATHKHLCSVSSSGWRSVFRGFGLAFTIHAISSVIAAPFVLAGIPGIVPLILCDILLVQLNAAWVHSVISASAVPWWRRLPPFGETLRATFLPMCALGLTTFASYLLPMLALLAMRRPGISVQTYDKNGPADLIIYLGLWLALTIFTVYPAQVVLTRAQASLLPDSMDTIVSFDRSLGRTTPNPSACQRVADAYKSFSGSWTRFYKLIAKTMIAAIMVGGVLGFFIGIEFGLVGYFARK
ncbi:hypothetical protein PG995_005601 [Apiospora arundinis]|jgi:hypothetical protein|uniref:Ubiquitin carrier protein n=1 Tax=Apiospora arundinis TaxID=335852 RepID=A0ABR2IAR0_9PEZI